MRCTVLLFAQIREAIGRERVELELPAGSTAGDALLELARQHPAVASMQSRLAIAVDERYQPRSAMLPDGCTIALIPPVSGG